MKKIILNCVLILIITACGEQPQAPKENAKPEIKIGVSLPLTGNLSYAGQGMKASLEVFQEDLVQKKLKNNYRFIFEDNAWNIKSVPVIMGKFLNVDKVDAVIDFGSSIGQVSSPFSEQHGIVHFNACASDIDIARGKFNFLHTTLPSDEAKILSQKVKEKYKKIVILGQYDISSQVTVEQIENSFNENNIEYKTFFVNSNERDMRMLINKMQLENPDLYVIILYSPTLEIFVKQFNEAGVLTPIMSTHFFANIADYKLINNAEFVDYAVMKKELKDRILNKTQGNNYEMCIGYIYDIADILVTAFENKQDKNEIVNYIMSLKTRTGVVGETSQDENGIFTVPASFKKIVDGKVVVWTK